MKKTITVNKHRYTGKQIANLMDESIETTDAGGKFIKLGGLEFYCQYRHDEHDGIYAPHVKNRSYANCIKLECRDQWRTEWVIL